MNGIQLRVSTKRNTKKKQEKRDALFNTHGKGSKKKRREVSPCTWLL